MRRRLRALPGYSLARFVYRALRHSWERGLIVARLFGTQPVFQPFGTTWENRYPEIFSTVRDAIGDGPDRRILSFGCATGEEVISLKARFPAAVITGIDINPDHIRQCRARWRSEGRDPTLSFATAAAEAPESVDAVFAMAVFRHGGLDDRPPRCDALIRFAEFEKSVGELARCLKPGGMLVIRHASFRFSDTAAAAGFEKIRSYFGEPISPIYGSDNLRLPDDRCDDGIFRKIKTVEGTGLSVADCPSRTARPWRC